jgi:hypothetical protein
VVRDEDKLDGLDGPISSPRPLPPRGGGGGRQRPGEPLLLERLMAGCGISGGQLAGAPDGKADSVGDADAEGARAGPGG